MAAPTARQARWLAGGGPLSIGTGYDADAFHPENIGALWATGRPDDEDGSAGFESDA